MVNRRLSMRKVREVPRLHYAAGMSLRAVARSGIAVIHGRHLQRAPSPSCLPVCGWDTMTPMTFLARAVYATERECA